jgi:hypothetical protein
MNRRELDRRRFLKAVGATALSYPFLRSLPSFAQAASDPTYLILVYTPCGVVRPNWGALGPARGATTPVVSALTGTSGAGAYRTGPTVGSTTGRSTLAQFASGTTDLTPYTTILDGLNVATADGSHEAGMAALWTGCLNSGPATGATSVSIDQAIAAIIRPPTPYASIQLMVRSSQDFTDREVKTRMIYGSSGGTVGFVDPIDNPIAALSQYFSSSGAASSASSSSGPSQQAYLRQAIFNQTNADLSKVASNLCGQDAAQIQAYQQMWNELNTSLKAASVAAATCMAPESPPSGYTAPATGPASEFPTSAKLQMDILALALACDLTRIGSLQFSTATSQVTHSWIDSTQTDIHHNYSHDGPSSFYDFCPYNGSGTYDIYNTANYQGMPFPSQYFAQLASIDVWYASQVAYLAQKLASLSTSSGKNLLAQSVICWGSELDMGAAHNHDDSPFILIGGGGGKLKGGQLVQFPLNLAQANNPPTNNRFHNDLLVTLAQVMGATSITSFGSTSGQIASGQTVTFNQGPITQILNT